MTTHQMRRILVGLATLFGVLVADQLSKWWILTGFDLPARGSVAITPFLNFTMVWNHAVTFGMLGGLGKAGPVVFCTIALVAVAALVWQITRTRRTVLAIAMGAIAGGAVGNVIDRLRFGAVVDFIHAHAFGWSWYVFNVADSAIVCGVAVWLVDSLRAEPGDARAR
ncbi:signal peptidase II [Brytella acorum]|uniref:Lipoprotein signal peptidase n=1 Tax=Brytella acorum TaxID=2959299 RepID=A0AA35VAL5_9PROT|nr:signal peptidase II [Brytella acorum]MDF3623654.1 signal peptidase II [Brytella acorum]CAI9119928.1 signal peptidase II [Brytella acorum]